MKLLYCRPQFKNFNDKRAKSQENRRLDYKVWKRDHNRGHVRHKTKSHSKRTGYLKQKPSYKYVEAPSVFSIRENTTECIEFLQKIEKHYNKREPIHIIMDAITQIENDTIGLLLSLMVCFKEKGIIFNGSKPKDPECRSKLDSSGFIDMLFGKKPLQGRNHLSLSQGKIHMNWSHQTDPVLVKKVVIDATNHVWGKSYRNTGINTMILELMANTFQHASKSPGRKEHWFLTVDLLKDDNKVCFSFIDYGIGVFQSLKDKKPGDKLYDLWNQFTKHNGNLNEAEQLKQIIEGVFNRSSTKLHYRGKGLPSLKKSLDNNWFSNLTVITNSAFANIARNEYTLLSESFSGTYIYWELNKENRKIERI